MEAALHNVGASKVSYSTDETPPRDTVYLVSGSRALVHKWPQRVLNPMLVLCNKHVRSKRMGFEGHLQWSWLRHETFEGVTQFQVVLGTNIPDLEPVKTGLRWTIHHVVDYSLKPCWAPAPINGQNQGLTLDLRLHPEDLTCDIFYYTHYSATGWGSR
jgi:hypothetical protein